MKETDKLLLQNKAWSSEKRLAQPTYFSRLAEVQTPRFLWIGCSDSRVPADQITGTEPGEIFVHRNVANLVVPSDLNFLAVLQYAVDVLEVDHVIVCGHYGCGGVRASLAGKSHGIIDEWLTNIKDVHRLHREELAALPEGRLREDKLIELSVREQTFNLKKTSVVQDAWSKRGGPSLHAWVYRLDDGILTELDAVSPGVPIDPIYRFR